MAGAPATITPHNYQAQRTDKQSLHFLDLTQGVGGGGGGGGVGGGAPNFTKHKVQ